MRAAAAFSIGLAAILATGHALADEETMVEVTEQRAGGDVYWWSAKAFGSSFGLVPFLNLKLADNIYLNAKLPLAANINGLDDKSRFALGNPTASVVYAAATPSLTWFVGARASIPLLTLFDDSSQNLAAATAGIAMSLWSAYLWEAYRLPLAAVGGVEAPVTQNLAIRVEGSPGLTIPLGDKAEPRKVVETEIEAHGEVEYRSESGFGGGGGLYFVWLPGEEGDNAQLAAEGFGSYSHGPLFARLGLLLALDEPLGFGFDKGKVATLHGAIGTRF